MATTNVVQVDVYQINQKALSATKTFAFPASGCILQDVSASPTRLLASGVNVYSAVQLLPTGSNGSSTLYYCGQTIAQLVALFNA